MKRALGAAVSAALLFSCLVGGTRPARAQQGVGPGSPSFVSPVLPEGFQPIGPDNDGLSPSGNYLVVQDQRGIEVVRTFDGAVVFFERLSASEGVTIGFDPSDHRLFVTDIRGPNDVRFRFIDPLAPATLYVQHFNEVPDIRTNLGGTVALIVDRNGATGQAVVTLLNGAGNPVVRRTFSTDFRWGIDLALPEVALLSTNSSGNTVIQLYAGRTGRLVFRATVSPFFQAGFDPFGFVFVVAQPNGTGSFTVQLVGAKSGQTLVFRTFSGGANAGFTPDGAILGVRSFDATSMTTFLFRTADGAMIPGP